MHHCLTFLRLLVIAAIFGFSLPSTAQPGLTSEGREFWFGFMPNYITPAQSISVYVATAVANDLRVETFGDGGSIVSSQSIGLAAGQAYKFKMSVGMSETRDREKPVYRAIRVTSTSPSTVIGYSDNSLSTDGFLAIPTPALGKEHYCLSYFDDAYSPGVDHLGGEFLIVAAYDSTNVTITSTARTSLTDDGKTIGHTPGQTWTINLRKGQTYLVQSTGWEYGVADLTGSKITSNKPVGFLSGHQRAEVELEDGNSKDHLIEMIPSTEHWGTEYFGIPQLGRPICGNYYRVMSAENGNAIKVNDSSVTLNAGQYAAFSKMTDVVHFVSTNKKRFMVMEYFYEQHHFGDPGPGDPDMVTLTQTSAFVNRALFRTPSNAGTAFKHYATFVAATDGIYSLRIKKGTNSPAPATAFGGKVEPIQNTSYSLVRILLSGDEITWFAECDVPFALDLYGFTDVESYAYPCSRSFATGQDSGSTFSNKIHSHDTCGTYFFDLKDKRGIRTMYLLQAADTALYHWHSYTKNYKITLPSTFVAGDTAVRVELSPIDQNSDGSFALYVLTVNGSDTIISGDYTVHPFEVILDSSLPLAHAGDTVCTTITLHNTYSDSASFFAAQLPAKSAYRIQPTGVVRVAGGDSAKFTLCFGPKNTQDYFDTVKVASECRTISLGVRANTGVPKITAYDHHFDEVKHGAEVCANVRIINQSSLPVTIVDYTISGSDAFRVDRSFPNQLGPGSFIDVRVCFQPPQDTGHYEARIDWRLDPATILHKTYTLLDGNAIGTQGISSEIGEGLSIWPNPATNTLSVSLQPEDRLVSIYAIDVLGSQHSFAFEKTITGVIASTQSLITGSYSLTIETNKGRYSRQLVIKR